MGWDVCRDTSTGWLVKGMCHESMSKNVVYESLCIDIYTNIAYVLFLAFVVGWIEKGQPPFDTHMCANASLSL